MLGTMLNDLAEAIRRWTEKRQSVSAGKTNAIPIEPSGRLFQAFKHGQHLHAVAVNCQTRIVSERQAEKYLQNCSGAPRVSSSQQCNIQKQWVSL